MEYLYCAVIGYLAGCINPSYLISRAKGYDIRKKGSGNAGASNAFIVVGKVIGVFCALFDIAKAYFACLIAASLFPSFPHALAVTGTACIIGHVFPFYMGFKGGKGLACIAGVAIFFDWRIFLAYLAWAVLVVVVTDYVCFVAPTCSVSFCFVYGFVSGDLVGALIFAVAAVVMTAKHFENFRRIKEGKEMRYSYILHPDRELKRITEDEGADEHPSKN